MKKFFLIIAAALTAAASCQKNDTVPASTEIKYNPIDLTLTASIEGAGTKVSYTEESNVLKAAWEKGDLISLVALDGSGNVLSMFSRQRAAAPQHSSPAVIQTPTMPPP